MKNNARLTPFLGAAVLLLLLHVPAWAGPEVDHSGVWESYSNMSRVEVHLTQEGEEINGVAYVYGCFGGSSTYHFSGTYRNGVIFATHHKGHRFVGEFDSPTEAHGMLTTAVRKMTINLTAKKIREFNEPAEE